jgi:hypothetical protein
VFSSGSRVDDRVDWAEFLGEQGFEWNRVPDWRGDGAFIGNGMMGSTIWAAEGETLHWDLGRCDVYSTGGRVESRVPIGKLVMKSLGDARTGGMALSLLKGEASGRITTSRGTIAWRSIMPHDGMVGLIEYATTGDEDVKFAFNQTLPIPSGTLRGMLRDFVEKHKRELGKGFSRKIVDFSDPVYQPIYRKLRGNPKYAKNFVYPDVNGCIDKGIQWRVQRFPKGGGYVVAWGVGGTGDGKSLCAYSVDFIRGGVSSPDQAVAKVRAALKEGYAAAADRQYAWQKDFLSKSFLSIPDKTIEKYYWRQIYKMGAATRPDGVVLDEIGPWFRATGWARVWCNINVQIAYHSMMTCGHLDLCHPFLKVFDGNWKTFADAVPEKCRGGDAMAVGRTIDIYGNTGWHWEYGDLAWVAHDYWMYCRYTGDEKRLREKCYPLIKGAATFMMNALRKDKDGIYHFPPDVSPEYSNEKYVDTNYNLALLRWTLRVLPYLNERFSLNDSDAERWKEVSDHLARYHVDANGLMVAKDVPFAKSHRHYSHLLAFYPLRNLSLENASGRNLSENSFDHWVALAGPGPKRKGWNSFSYFGAAGMAAWLGRGDEASEFLREGIAGTTPSTFFKGPGPAIESVLCGTVGTCGMLLQSATSNPGEYRLKIFPALPKAWGDASFRDLRGEGAFVVSAAMEKGKFQFAEIESLEGKSFFVELPTTAKVGVLGGGTSEDLGCPDGRRVFKVELSAGGSVVFVAEELLESGEPLSVKPVEALPVATEVK